MTWTIGACARGRRAAGASVVLGGKAELLLLPRPIATQNLRFGHQNRNLQYPYVKPYSVELE